VVGDYDRATRLAAEAAGLQGDDPPGLAAAQATLAALLNLQGRPREAQVAAREGLKDIANAGALPTRLQLLTELARSQWDLGEQDLARHTLDKALALAGDHRLASEQAELLTLRGYWNTRLTRFAQADADLRHAIALATPSYPLVANEARRVLAQNLLVQDRVDDGLRIAEELLADYRRRLGDSHPLVGRAWRVLANLQCTGGSWRLARRPSTTPSGSSGCTSATSILSSPMSSGYARYWACSADPVRTTPSRVCGVRKRCCSRLTHRSTRRCCVSARCWPAACCRPIQREGMNPSR
jgi:hypothetical protein